MIFRSDRKDGVIPSFSGKRSCLKYTLNACKLDWEENIFDFYVESIAFKIKILINLTLLHLRLMQKALQLPFCFFFLFFFLVTFSGQTAKKVFSERFMTSYLEGVWPTSDSFLGHAKMPFRKYCYTSCYLWRMWHMTHLMHGNQHSKHPEKHKKQSTRNLETSYPVDGRKFKGQNRDKSSG